MGRKEDKKEIPDVLDEEITPEAIANRKRAIEEYERERGELNKQILLFYRTWINLIEQKTGKSIKKIVEDLCNSKPKKNLFD